jgi:outer membrane protein assembly factor BamB
MQKVRLLGTVTLFGLASAVISAQAWPQWRGPARDGRAAVKASASPAAKAIEVWKVPVGIGHSSPVVDANRVYVFTRRDERETIAAFDLATGKTLWSTGYDVPYQMNPAAREHGKGPKSTPVVSGGRLFTLGITGVLSAVETATGKPLWRASFEKEFPVGPPEFGSAMSPMVDGDAVIAHVGGKDRGALRAFDAATGRVLWSWTEDGPGYASPVIVEAGGVRQIVTQTQQHIVGVERATGKSLWKLRFDTAYQQNIVTPLVYRDLVVLSGLDKSTFAVRVTHQGATWKPETVWENTSVPMYMSSPVLNGDVIYGLTHRNRGQFFALDAKSGKTLWTSPPRQGENAAIVGAADVLFCLTSDAQLKLVRATGGSFQLLATLEVATSPTWAHPVILGDRVLVKDEQSLALLKIG